MDEGADAPNAGDVHFICVHVSIGEEAEAFSSR